MAASNAVKIWRHHRASPKNGISIAARRIALRSRWRGGIISAIASPRIIAGIFSIAGAAAA
jgi:hypothetical protein